MTDNQHESVARVARYANHVTELAARFRVLLRVNARQLPHQASAGVLARDRHLPITEQRNIVLISPVIDETTYAVALHELGHCLHPLGRVDYCEGSRLYRETKRCATLQDVRLLLLSERSAWEWARQHALEWTDLMTQTETFSINSYRMLARKLGVKEDR